MTETLNVLGEKLEICCTSPMTGFYRDGYCQTEMSDVGSHVVCAEVTEDFLEFTNLSDRQFNIIADNWRNKKLWTKVKNKWVLNTNII